LYFTSSLKELSLKPSHWILNLMLPRKIIFIILAVAYCPCYAVDQLTPKDSSTVTIMLQNASDKLSKIDSVFLIFDRYDLRGAGVIKKVFYPDVENKIRVCLPKGKYYINIYCLGIYNKESFDRIVYAKPSKNHNIYLRLQASALFHQGDIRIPSDHFDPSHLAILNFSK
jgi:hypothetical protein